MLDKIISVAVLLLGLSHEVDRKFASHTDTRCKYIPGDKEFPVKEVWDQLNSTVHGRLIGTVPAATVCHGKYYDEKLCNSLKQEWDFPQPHIHESAEIMSPYWQNQSCDPFTARATPCKLGNYVSYSINVTGVDDIKAGIHFAKKHNIRLVIKNTGHDYLGRSTGKGALGLWMQNLKSMTVFDNYKSTYYSGPAMRLGAGVLSADAYVEAHKHGLRVVGGGCPSVGIAGGYTQGGGHSLLTSTHGLSADNALEWEVVTADGEHIVATPTKYPDLYWALSGGGSGNYAVVLSVTVKAHQDGLVGGTYLTFNSSGISSDAFWEGIETFHANLPSVVDAGAAALYQITDGRFLLLSLTSPGLSRADVIQLLSPFVKWLDEHGVSYVYVPTEFPSFHDHFAATFGPLPYGPIPVSDVISSRLIPRSVITDQLAETTRTFRSIVEGQPYYLGIAAMNSNKTVQGAPANAVLPAWRSALLQFIVGSPWDWSIPRDQMLLRNKKLVEEIIPSLVSLTPKSGTYMNEGNIEQINWQDEYFGGNYDRLLGIKQRYDPGGLFYAAAGVGSDQWTFDVDSRLCNHDKTLALNYQGGSKALTV